MARNNNLMISEIKKNLEMTDNKVKKIESNLEKIETNVKEIKNTLDDSKAKETVKSSRKILKYILTSIVPIASLGVAIISLIVAIKAFESSKKIGINNSALSFSYQSVNIEKLTTKEGIEIVIGGSKRTRGGAKLKIDVKVESGQMASLYLIEKNGEKLEFELLNSENIQNRFSGIKTYEVNAYFDMEKKEKIKNIKMGMGQLYVLAENLNGQVYIDVIQIIGPIIQESDEMNTAQVYDNYAEYSFRYLKNNKLITLNENDDFDKEWVELTDTYPESLKETNIEKIEEDISMIREKYSKYKY